MWGWRALSDGFLLQDIVTAGVGEASEKRDEPAAGEAVSLTALRLASQGLAQHGWGQSTVAGTAGGRDMLLGWGMYCSVLVGEVA